MNTFNVRTAVRHGLLATLISSGIVHAIDLDVADTNSIISAAKTIKDNILSIYNNGSSGPAIPGIFPRPYYWWEAGLAFDSLINYVTLTQDDSVVSTIQDGLLFQVGPELNFMPPNQTASEGNDDQATWAHAAMTAAEQDFPLRPGSNTTWLQLAQNVFENQAARWDLDTCGGGLRWQIFSFNAGYTYKNAQSLGGFATLAARLARYTGNVTYSDWAQKAVTWADTVGLISTDGAVFDGTDSTENCSSVNRIQWTVNAGWFINTGAYLANASNINTNSSFTTDLIWPVFSTANSVFTASSASADSSEKDILYEAACQPEDTCDVDQLSYRASFARALGNARGLTSNLAATSNGTTVNDFHQRITTILQASAQGAAAQCSGGEDGTACGSDWTSSTWDGSQGLGQELSALEVILANLPKSRLATANTTTAGGASSNGTSTTGTTSATTGNNASGATSSPSTGAASGLEVASLASIALAGLLCAVL